MSLHAMIKWHVIWYFLKQCHSDIFRQSTWNQHGFSSSSYRDTFKTIKSVFLWISWFNQNIYDYWSKIGYEKCIMIKRVFA